MNTEKGFAHALLIIGIVVALIVGLLVVFWKNFGQNELRQSPVGATEENIRANGSEYYTFTSPTGSGLSFKYPSTWFFEPPANETSSGEKRTTSYMLFSRQMNVVDSRPEVASDHMCVTFTELKGDWPFRSTALDNSELLEKFAAGPNEISLMMSSEPFNMAAMKLVSSNPISEHGAYYVALKNDYYLVATSQKNCYPSETLQQRDIVIDIEQAKSIMRSVQLVD